MFVIEKLQSKTGRWFKIWGDEESTGAWVADYLKQCQELQPKEEFRMRWIPVTVPHSQAFPYLHKQG